MSRTSSRPETFSKPDTTSRTNGKQVFTTGEAARLCNLSQQTIIRCFDRLGLYTEKAGFDRGAGGGGRESC